MTKRSRVSSVIRGNLAAGSQKRQHLGRRTQARGHRALESRRSFSVLTGERNRPELTSRDMSRRRAIRVVAARAEGKTDLRKDHPVAPAIDVYRRDVSL